MSAKVFHTAALDRVRDNMAALHAIQTRDLRTLHKPTFGAIKNAFEEIETLASAGRDAVREYSNYCENVAKGPVLVDASVREMQHYLRAVSREIAALLEAIDRKLKGA